MLTESGSYVFMCVGGWPMYCIDECGHYEIIGPLKPEGGFEPQNSAS